MWRGGGGHGEGALGGDNAIIGTEKNKIFISNYIKIYQRSQNPELQIIDIM